MADPGYYKSNYRALTLSGAVRMRGLLRLPLTYLITRFKAPTPAVWMPQMWADLECTESELSSQFFQATAVHREKFRSLGFTEMGFKKLRRVLNPHHRDNGGINFLDGSHCHFGQLFYNKFHAPHPINKDRERVVIAFSAVFEKDTLSCTNNTKTPFDSAPRQTVFRIPSKDVAHIHRRFIDELKRRNEQPRNFPDLQSLRSWFDSNATEVFDYRVRRGLFLRMSDDEVAAARRRLPPPLPKT